MKPQEGQVDTYDAHKTTTEVRQASRTLDNLWVLIISVLAIVAIFGAIYLVFFFNTPPSAISP
jgi:flagellar basal body-associated protein FliL